MNYENKALPINIEKKPSLVEAIKNVDDEGRK